MDYPGLTLTLRHVAALALVAPVACTVDNQGFLFDTDPNGSDTATATTAPTSSVSSGSSGSSVGTADTGVVDTGLTGEGPGSGPTATSEPAGSTSDASTDTTNTGSTSDTGAVECANYIYTDIPAAFDAFFIAGSTGVGTTCNYYGGVPGAALSPCYELNLGTTGALQFAKHDDKVEAMYAIRFAEAPLLMLAQSQVQVDFAELNLTGWGLVETPLVLEVGLLGDSWEEGKQNGTKMQMGDSSYQYASYGLIATEWTNGDGPRGASQYAADLLVDVPLDDHFPLVSDAITLGDDFVEQLAQRGLSVSYPLDTENFTYGPGLKSKESVEMYHPFLRIYGCLP